MKTPWWIYVAIFSPFVATFLGLFFVAISEDDVKKWEIIFLLLVMYGGLGISLIGMACDLFY